MIRVLYSRVTDKIFFSFSLFLVVSLSQRGNELFVGGILFDMKQNATVQSWDFPRNALSGIDWKEDTFVCHTWRDAFFRVLRRGSEKRGKGVFIPAQYGPCESVYWDRERQKYVCTTMAGDLVVSISVISLPHSLVRCLMLRRISWKDVSPSSLINRERRAFHRLPCLTHRKG